MMIGLAATGIIIHGEIIVRILEIMYKRRTMLGLHLVGMERIKEIILVGVVEVRPLGVIEA